MASATAPIEEEQSIIRCPEVPFVSAIVGGMFPGRAVVISGYVTQSSSMKRFSIDLCCGLLISGDHMDNKALHFNPRFETGGIFSSGDRQLVLNSYIGSRWGDEVRFTNPFEEGKPFQVRILACDKYFKIAVNGRHLCDYEHRVSVDQIKTIAIAGCVRLDFVEFQPPISKGANNSQSIEHPPKQLSEVTRIDKPTIPFSLALPMGGFVSPHMMQFTLTPFISGERFTIDLHSAGESVFHFRIDMPKDKQKAAVVRNSTKSGEWQKEEREFGEFPFHRGITHDITFIAYSKSVAVDVDGMPFVKFSYRYDDPVLIDRVVVKGDCVLQRFIHRG